MNSHTTAKDGKRVRVVLKNGIVFFDKLIESKTRYFVLEKYGAVMKKNVMSFAIARATGAAP